HFFALTAEELAELSALHTVGSRTLFILQLGYFKAVQQFFVFEPADVADDVYWIQQAYFANATQPIILAGRTTRLKQQQLILRLTGYRLCGETEREQLRVRATQAVRISSKPLFILRDLRRNLSEQKIVAPGYSVLQDMISMALIAEQERLGTIIETHLSPSDTEALLQLLKNPHGLYEITRIKREPKDFGEKEMRREIERGEQIATLHDIAQRILSHLSISDESIKYYASLVGYYSVYKLQRFDRKTTFIYLLCFVYHRYRQMHDNLLNCLIYQVHLYNETARKIAKEQIIAFRQTEAEGLAQAGQVLRLFTTAEIAPETPFSVVKANAFAIVAEDELEKLADSMIQQATIDETAWQWAYLDERHVEFKRRLRPILRALTFEAMSAKMPLLNAICFIQEALCDKRILRHLDEEDFPLAFVPEHVKRYLYKKEIDGKKHLAVDRYEFLVYRMLRHALIAGDIFCRHSVRFRSLDDDLLDEERWAHKETLLEETGLARLRMPVESLLDELEAELEQQITAVNERIQLGQNQHVKRKAGGRWSLPYTRAASPINHVFFEQIPDIDIQTIVQFAHQQTGMLDCFEHVQPRYAKHKRDDASLIAALIAWGTNMGIGRMGNISDIRFNTLSSISNNYLRLETLHAANDVLSDATAALPIFQLYDIDNAVHSSSDGQKFETRIHTINARHSSKYFGLSKGVSAYTLVANHVPLNAQVIGTHEHESHYVFDLLVNNTTTVQPTIHSTDTHGANHVNFALLHVFGYQFAPRYKDIYDKVRTGLYGFKHPSQYDDKLLLKPIRKVQKPLVISEWDNMVRIFLSLALKTTTQSIIVSKLSSYARKNRTKRALWEFDNILRSLYLLYFIDSLTLRRNVQRALGRGEAYNQLRRAVSFANFGALRFRTEGDQQIWGECSRLLTNCIIYYNAVILSRLLETKLSDIDETQAQRLARVSPIAWRHINFQGRYNFRQTSQTPDIDELVEKLKLYPISLIEPLD
ncbi:MAG: Tn3 family transposase, partial [Chloroflexi bacterium]|nr:Tn3 family transposase [Chloroflexota bacterium]